MLWLYRHRDFSKSSSEIGFVLQSKHCIVIVDQE